MNEPTYNGMSIMALSLAIENDGRTEVKIERARQRDGSSLWAIRRDGSVMNKNAEWEFEPMPSSRDDEFIKNCRYATIDEAVETYKRYQEKLTTSVGFLACWKDFGTQGHCRMPRGHQGDCSPA